MRRGVLVLLIVALTVAGIAMALRHPPGWGPGGLVDGQDTVRNVAPAAPERARDVLAVVEARGGEPQAG
jgi:hypothetical protein